MNIQITGPKLTQLKSLLNIDALRNPVRMLFLKHIGEATENKVVLVTASEDTYLVYSGLKTLSDEEIKKGKPARVYKKILDELLKSSLGTGQAQLYNALNQYANTQTNKGVDFDPETDQAEFLSCSGDKTNRRYVVRIKKNGRLVENPKLHDIRVTTPAYPAVDMVGEIIPTIPEGTRSEVLQALCDLLDTNNGIANKDDIILTATEFKAGRTYTATMKPSAFLVYGSFDFKVGEASEGGETDPEPEVPAGITIKNFTYNPQTITYSADVTGATEVELRVHTGDSYETVPLTVVNGKVTYTGQNQPPGGILIELVAGEVVASLTTPEPLPELEPSISNFVYDQPTRTFTANVTGATTATLAVTGDGKTETLELDVVEGTVSYRTQYHWTLGTIVELIVGEASASITMPAPPEPVTISNIQYDPATYMVTAEVVGSTTATLEISDVEGTEVASFDMTVENNLASYVLGFAILKGKDILLAVKAGGEIESKIINIPEDAEPPLEMEVTETSDFLLQPTTGATGPSTFTVSSAALNLDDYEFQAAGVSEVIYYSLEYFAAGLIPMLANGDGTVRVTNISNANIDLKVKDSTGTTVANYVFKGFPVSANDAVNRTLVISEEDILKTGKTLVLNINNVSFSVTESADTEVATLLATLLHMHALSNQLAFVRDTPAVWLRNYTNQVLYLTATLDGVVIPTLYGQVLNTNNPLTEAAKTTYGSTKNGVEFLPPLVTVAVATDLSLYEGDGTTLIRTVNVPAGESIGSLYNELFTDEQVVINGNYSICTVTTTSAFDKQYVVKASNSLFPRFLDFKAVETEGV